MDETEARYTHLLQPIRDMTKNWEVDVAAQLGEYMHELDQICISFDGGKTTMNFAEAALLIQGSACIYSKKVEYLYSLVYQTLDFISNKKREKQPASVGVDGVDKDATFAHRNEEEEFLSLDDINGTNKSNMDMRKNNSSNVVDIVPLTPMGLVPPEEAEKKDNPLYSRKGEILASCKDFRVNTYTPHANGAFVLDLAGISPTREFLREGNNRNASVLDVGPGDENGNLQAGTSNNEALLPILNFSDLGGAGDNDCDDNDAGDAFPPLAEGNDMEVDPSPSEHVERRQAVNDRHMLRERALAPAETEKPKEFLDPWRSLDPFSNSEDKPFKKGKHFTIPRGVEETTGNNRKRKGPTKLQDFRKWFSGTYYEGADVKGKKKGPTFADMEVLYWKNMKERLVAQKKIQKKMGILFSNEIAEHQNKDLENAEEQNEVEDNRHDDYLDNDGGDDFSDHENLAQDFPAEILDEEGLAATEPQEERPSYEDLVRRNVDLFIANSQKYARETVLSIRVRDWEDKMGPQLTEQEERVAFDIHDYGDKIVDAFSQVGERRTFASIVKGKEAFEVCRYKLASLQLANDCTVKIDKKPGLYESIDSMELTLLSKRRAHERFQTYAAPSLTDF
ncbi:condensin-2 complex subunit H2-like [Acipenser ruthenus]|uniref:condensin-2 complex subunit H2-like n=1 Tax=Acipenser ruthenus TaxID=7906 RepID=UPI00274173C1|nr:condensin-2 complex subunit H2-like [Acipenser ruthenus]XP_033880180.3 condensin-2 complex subunit H2-like [Acipenser ruthenus]XP_058883252.1 condensin-2 complex subunit H2-like [Acipenser ruthenus]